MNLLTALRGQTRAHDDVVVVNAGPLTDRAEQWHGEREVRVVDAGPAFPGRARNVGISNARHDWVALLDSGCTPSPDWLAALVAPVDDTSDPPLVVFGTYEPEIDGEWAVAQALTILAPRGGLACVRGPSTASMLIHRSAWEAAGRFPESLRAAEDLVFFDRLAAAGVPTAWAPKAVVQWTMAPSLAAFFRRMRTYAQHHLAAGLARTWHMRVMAMDAAALALLVGGFLWPLAWAVAALGALARVVSTIRRRSGNVAKGAFRPDRIARVAMLLLLADLALWLGVLDHLREPHPAP